MRQDHERPLVSVVTPFYNTAEHLRECIESVLGQDYPHFEYILQDNASTDGGDAIAREYAARDPRIRHVRNEALLPQVPNYNLALSRIDPASRYTKMVQADDWLVRDCLSRMVERFEGAPNVGLVSALRYKGSRVEGEGLQESQTVVDGREVCRMHLLRPMHLFGSPSTVMYRSDVVRSRRPFFAEGRLNEDTEACYEILGDWDFGFVHEVLSYTRIEESSTFGTVREFDAVALGWFVQATRYAPRYLEAGAAAARQRELEWHYYRQLARAWWSRRGEDYWAFHRRWLAAEGLRIERSKLAQAIARELASRLGSQRSR